MSIIKNDQILQNKIYQLRKDFGVRMALNDIHFENGDIVEAGTFLYDLCIDAYTLDATVKDFETDEEITIHFFSEEQLEEFVYGIRKVKTLTEEYNKINKKYCRLAYIVFILLIGNTVLLIYSIKQDNELLTILLLLSSLIFLSLIFLGEKFMYFFQKTINKKRLEKLRKEILHWERVTIFKSY